MPSIESLLRSLDVAFGSQARQTPLQSFIEPFYSNLQVLTAPKEWPKLAEGVPRRASVNSFGFGGTNSHVIIESYVPRITSAPNDSLVHQFTPFNFSTSSERSLRGILVEYADYLRDNEDISLQDLSYTLYARRTQHGVRTSISARTAPDLRAEIAGLLGASSDGSKSHVLGVRAKAPSNPVRILGVFTGQRAQWPTMGRELIRSSQYVKKVVQDLDLVLQSLPEPERPEWMLMDELSCDASESRLDSAAIAQPLCTVVQIILHDLFRSTGVQFDAVVGHSSGEIAAAYAAGYITREDAVKIAFYRGHFTSLTPSDQPGGMMAVGTTVKDATELCDLPMFRNRLCVAAINSSSSVTISGDREAIQQAKEVLEDEKKFARILRVDKAYHSPHMESCAKEYLEVLQRSEIRPLQPSKGPAWFSSTYKNREIHEIQDLSGPYWAENMVRPVLFSDSVQAAARTGAFDIAIEVGPHPALKGPTLQILQESQKEVVLYTGLLQRARDDVEALSEALGYLWSHVSCSIDFRAFDSLISGQEQRSLVHGLPTYCWDHEKMFWHGSRASRAFLSRKDPPNPLLGSRTTDIIEHEMRWRNFLRLSELPWVRGHQLQGQVIYPATAYISTAVEAARLMVPDQKAIALIEVQDFNLGKPLVFSDDDTGIETLFTLSNIRKDSDGSYSSNFTYHACDNAETEQSSTHATGSVTVILGGVSSAWLPSRKVDPPNLVNIPEDRFYTSLEPLGYNYTGYFRSLSSIKRKLNFSSTIIQVPPHDDEPETMALHPALLDSALQGIFLAYCWPGDGSLNQLHVPTGIKSFRANLPLCQQGLVPGFNVTSCSHLTQNSLVTRQLDGDVEIYSNDGTCLVQMEGIKVVPLAEPTSKTDRSMFSKHVWGLCSPNCELAMEGKRATSEDYGLAHAMERVSIDYMKQMVALFPPPVRGEMNLPWHFLCLFDFFSDVLSTVEAGTRQCAQKSWLEDRPVEIVMLKAKFAHKVDMKLACAVGDNLPAVIRGETTILEHLTKDNMLDQFYEVGLGLKEFSTFLGRAVKQVVHRHPRMNILEIGAGTGGATKVIMNDIGRSFSSYTYTDISTGFFETAQEVFLTVKDRMVFKTLDIEKDIVEQGYMEHSYDLVVASLVLHATADLKRTLANTRRLLKPGGYLVIQEVSNNDVCRVGFLMCALPGWWLGQDDGRKLSPCVSTLEWHKLLLETNFSGVDSCTPELDATPFPLAVMVSQATDDRVAFLREPLSSASIQVLGHQDWDLVLIGGQSLYSAQTIERIIDLDQRFEIRYAIFKDLGDIDTEQMSPKTAILCLTELDEPVFKSLTEGTLEGMKKLFETQRTILWITQGCRSENPFMNMTVGLGRSLMLENSDLVLQFLDLEIGVEPNPRQILEALLRLRQGDIWKKEGKLNDVLWTVEHELAYHDGALTVSRVYHETTLNDRYNASKRTVLQEVDPLNCSVILSNDSSGKHTLAVDGSLAASMLNPQFQTETPDVLIKVSHSLLDPVLGTALPSYLVLGIDATTEDSVVAISNLNGSFALASPDYVLDIELPVGKEAQFLSRIHAGLLIEQILQLCSPGRTALIYEPPPEVAPGIIQRASDADLAVSFLTSSTKREGDGWTKVEPYSPRRTIEALLPSDVSVFIDCAVSGQGKRTGSLIATCLPQSCPKTTIDGLATLRHVENPAADFDQRVDGLIQGALRETLKDEYAKELPSISLGQLDGRPEVGLSEAMIVNWSASTPVSVPVSTIHDQVIFRADRTYVLFGLTSDLAQSLCDWMADHGARNIILTSRNPNIEGGWIEQLAELGVTVKAFANDITDKKSLSTLVNHIRETFPPIAGIAHGAMVLDDTSFFEMPFEKMDKVLRPKVQGPTHLDELFQDTSLDFFVFFSSVTAIAGNRGQSAYTAANMFMSSLATQRWRKGLAASILHIGAVMGVGYINREFSDGIFAALRKTGFMLMSEREFHLCFGEAVLASHPLSGRNPEVITALETANLVDVPPQWTKFPRFQHCLQGADRVDNTKTSNVVAVSTKHGLLEATTAEQVYDIVQDAFFLKLQAALQISAEADKSHVLSSGTDDLGIDSLVAVEIRSWFLKELDTEIPVFKILSGGSVTQLLEYAIENLPTRLTPNWSDIDKSSRPIEAIEVKEVSGLTSLAENDPEKNNEDGSQLDFVQGAEHRSSVTSLGNEPPKSFEKILPISPGQSRFWVLKHLMEDQTTANSTIPVAIKGAIDLDSLDRAVRKVASRHEALRTSFFVDDDQKPVQAISKVSSLHLERMMARDESRVDQEFKNLKNHIYQIEQGQCMRLIHLSITPTDSYLLIGSHHIVMDGVSLGVFLADLEKAYNGHCLSEQTYQYSEYSERFLHDLASEKMQEDIEYWSSELTNVPEPLPLLPFATQKNRASLKAYGHTSLSRSIDSALAEQIESTCRKLKGNVFHFYVGVFEVLLHKVFGTTDICIGMAHANRWDDQVTNSIGMYLNLLPLRFHLTPEQSFDSVLKETRRKTYLAMSHSRLPFDILLDNINCERSAVFSPLFQAFINYRQGVKENRTFGNAIGTTKEVSLPRTGYDISLDIIENPGAETRITFMLQDSLYSVEDTSRLIEMYFKLLEDFSTSCSQILSKVSLFSPADISNAIQLGKGPVMSSKWPETLVHRISDMIAKNPDKPAVKEVDGKVWSYQQLEAEINKIASALLQANIKPRSVVAVFQHASPHFIFSLLGILRIGAICVPLDCSIPPARLRVILAECKPAALLASGTTVAQTDGLDHPPSTIILDVSNLPTAPSTTRNIAANGNDPAAFLFTSGSSGVPKGVVLSHASLCNHAEAVIYAHGFGSETVLQQSSLAFDMSLNQIFMALANGGTLVIVPESLRRDPFGVTRILVEEHITYTSATPSEYLTWFRYGSSKLSESNCWKYATAGGEHITEDLLQGFRNLKRHFKHSFHVFNAYGPTETSMSSNETEVDLDVSQTAFQSSGKCLPNYSIYIMDANMCPLPVGFPGEICIAGAGVAHGYLNTPDPNEDKFLKDPSPSSFAIGRGWDRMYRTGDKGILAADGSLQVFGRIERDTQVKLRGLRIEMQDIERSIMDTAKGQLKEVVVTPRGDPTLLVAHVVLSSGDFLEAQSDFLHQLACSLPLPQYMQPAAIIPLKSMPLTVSGKVDRKALMSLPLPAARHKKTDVSEGLTKMETALAKIWEAVLPQQVQGIQSLDARSDFFHVGGNSMLLIELRELIKREFTIHPPLLHLFEHSTLGSMAAVLQSYAPEKGLEIDWEKETEVPAGFVSERSHPGPGGSNSSRKVIVLTGSTGFLGKHILRLLVDEPNVDKVHCIAIRRIDKLAEFASLSKVATYKGDLSLPRCGLSEAQADAIFESADVIIHNGADVSFLKTYQSLRAPNLSSTKELFKLGLVHCSSFHFISTGTVGKLNKTDYLAPESLAQFVPEPTFTDAYAASKWASEVFLERAGQQFGLPVFIHRPSSITGDNAGETDIVSNVLRYSAIIKALPETKEWRGFVDLVTVETAAAGIVDAVLQVKDDHTRIQYMHHAGERVIPAQSIKEVLNSDAKIEWQSLSMHEWVEQAVQHGMNSLVGEFLSSMDSGQGLQIGQKLLLHMDEKSLVSS